MAIDHSILSTWRTPDLICRDQQLRARTAMCGMSPNAMTVHIAVLVLTGGTSLPFNLLFGIHQAATYKKVKHERHSIRQILGARNVTYTGGGQWMLPQVMHPVPGPGPWMDPNGGQYAHPNVMHPGPGPGPWMHPDGGQHAHPNVIYSHGTGQSADPNGGINNTNGTSDFQDQMAQAAMQGVAQSACDAYFNNWSTATTTTDQQQELIDDSN